MQGVRDIFSRSCERYATEPCMASRKILRMRVEAGVDKYILGPYEWINYREAQKIVGDFGRGLRALGIQPQTMVNFFADTCKEWQLAAQACFQQNIVVTTTYANLGEDAVSFAIQQTEVTTVITDAVLATTTLANVLKNCPKVKRVIYIPDRRPVTHSSCPSEEDIIKALPRGVKVYSFQAVCELGFSKKDDETCAPPETVNRNDLCVVMYTSGSTARPKGVLISNGNMLAVVAGTSMAIPNMGPGDRFVAYLPLAHILEMIAEIGSLACGSAIGYGTPKTLSNTGINVDPETCLGDAPELKPTLLAAVPMIFDKIRSAVFAKVKATGGLKAKLFFFALDRKIKALDNGRSAPLWDLILFDKLRAQLLGGKVRYMLSGGGPLSKATQVFMNVVFNCPVGQGMGCTECVGAMSTCWPNDRTYGKVGAPIQCNQIKLVDWPEGEYFVTDKPNPRGEILVGGPNVTLGYFKMPEETAKSFYVDSDGIRWFRTGDVGEMWPNGTLQIIDRKKDFIKLSGGEFISYGKLEPLVRDSEYVENAFIFADPEKSFCIAVCTAKPHLTGDKFPRDDAVLQDIHRIFKAHGCLSFEIPKKVKVVSEQWTPESDLVSAAMKIKRHNLIHHYKDLLKELYESGPQ